MYVREREMLSREETILKAKRDLGQSSFLPREEHKKNLEELTL